MWETEGVGDRGRTTRGSSRAAAITFLHVDLQDGAVPEDECVEHGLARRVEGPVQRDVAAGLAAAGVQAVDVAVDPLHQEVHARSDRAGGGGTER